MNLGSFRLAPLLAAFALPACADISLGTSSGSSSSSSGDDEVVDETVVAGANQNDRSASKDGDDLQTGAMVVSPSGRHIVMQRNTVTLIYDVATARYHELDTPLLRVAFAKGDEVVYGVRQGGTLVALELATREVRWSSPIGSAAVTLLRISDDDGALVVGDATQVRVVETRRGAVTSTVPADQAAFAAFVPGEARALVVARTVWRDGGPHTPVLDVALDGARAPRTLDVPNCASPIVVTPDARRAFLSPTYCSPGTQPPPGEVWTNPDPVSVIDLGTSPRFVKNLPGFGPVALSTDGSRLVAYLDVKRMDPSMFDDRAQVPWEDGPRYHLMTIDPKTLSFRLASIGNAIPRFALTRDGRGLLVDASRKLTSRTKIAARATATFGPDGIQTTVETNLDVFGSASAFGYFDLATQSFASFSGPTAPLDRFVQLDGGRVLTLAKRADGLGGTPFLVDVASRRTVALQGDFGSGVRDVGLAADGRAFLRLRLPANQRDGGFYSREGLCVSSDGTCGSVSLTATYESSVPFATVQATNECPENHDCF